MNKEFSFVEEAIKKAVREKVSETIEEEITGRVNKFHRELTSRKDEYISEVMKGIRIFAEEKSPDMIPRYKIEFENIYRLEG